MRSPEELAMYRMALRLVERGYDVADIRQDMVATVEEAIAEAVRFVEEEDRRTQEAG